MSLYVFVAIGLCVIGFTLDSEKTGSRLVLGSPIWPIFPAIGLVLLVRSLWKMADFGGNHD